MAANPGEARKLWPMIINVHKSLSHAKAVWSKAAQRNKPAYLRYALTVALFVTDESNEQIRDFIASSLKTTTHQLRMRMRMRVSVASMERLLLNADRVPPSSKAHDMHVYGGRSESQKIQFRTEGAVVSNQHPLFINKDLEQTYILSKK